MVPRWSRLALAAILAFGASPALAAAAEARAPGGAPRACPCSPDGLAGASLATSIVGAGEVIQLERCQGVGPLPLCAPAPVAAVAPPAPVPAQVTDLRLADHEPAPREAAWRLAPKTSPPAR